MPRWAAQGKALTQKLRLIHAEAAAAHAAVQALAYDPLDTGETAFVGDYAAWGTRMQELEGRLAAVVSQVRGPAALAIICGSRVLQRWQSFVLHVLRIHLPAGA